MTNYVNDEANNVELPVKFRMNSTAPASRSSSRDDSFGRRRGKSPQQFNGIHRRRRKKMAW